MQEGLTSLKASNMTKREHYTSTKCHIFSKKQNNSQMTLKCPTIFDPNKLVRNCSIR